MQNTHTSEFVRVTPEDSHDIIVSSSETSSNYASISREDSRNQDDVYLKCKNFEDQIQQLLREVDDLKEQNDLLKKQQVSDILLQYNIEALKDNIKTKDFIINSAQKQLEIKTIELENAQNDRRNLQQAYETAQEELRNVKAQLEQVQLQKQEETPKPESPSPRSDDVTQKLNQELQEERTNSDELRKQNQALNAKITELQGQLTDIMRQPGQERHDINEKSKIIIDVTAKNKQLAEEFEGLKSSQLLQSSKIQQDTSSSQQKPTFDYGKQLREMEMDLDYQKNIASKRLTELRELQDKYKTVEQNLQNKTNEAEKLKTELAQAQERVKSLEKSNEEKTKNIYELEAIIRQKNAEIEGLNNRIIQLRSKIDEQNRTQK